MKKLLLTAFVAIGIGILTSLQLAGADPIGVLFLKDVTPPTEDGRINPIGDVMEFDIKNDYGTSANISRIDFAMDGEIANGEDVGILFSGSGFSFSGFLSQNFSGGISGFIEGITGLSFNTGETKHITVQLDGTNVNNPTFLDEVEISNVILSSGSGVYLDTGSGLTVDNPLWGRTKVVTFPNNFGIKNASDFATATTFTEDLSLPIDFSTGEFTFPTETTLEAATTISGVTDGLQVIIPAGAVITGSGSWNGEIEAPEVLGLPSLTNLPNITAQKRISVGVEGESLTFSSPVTISIPIIGSGTRRVYSSQNGVTWTYETDCEISANICSFSINHFTQFLVGSTNGYGTTIGGYSADSSSGGGQNDMRHGNYDPNRRNAQGIISISPEIHTTIYGRSTKYLQKLIPCEVNEENILANRMNNLKLLQGAPKMCREDAFKYFNLPYKTYKR